LHNCTEHHCPAQYYGNNLITTATNKNIIAKKIVKSSVVDAAKLYFINRQFDSIRCPLQRRKNLAVCATLLFLLVEAYAGPPEAFSFISFHPFGGFSALALFLYRNSLLFASAAADEGADLILLSNYALMEGFQSCSPVDYIIKQAGAKALGHISVSSKHFLAYKG
jgi:hypothetical protein